MHFYQPFYDLSAPGKISASEQARACTLKGFVSKEVNAAATPNDNLHCIRECS